MDSKIIFKTANKIQNKMQNKIQLFARDQNYFIHNTILKDG